MASRLANKMDVVDDFGMNPNRKIPPIQSLANDSANKRTKLKLTDSLVAPISREKIDVPNHLLNTSTHTDMWHFDYTEIYAKLQRNQIFEVTPVEVHFAGFEISSNNDEQRVYAQMLRVINISDQVRRMTVLPPALTKYFDVNYVKQDRLVPGFALEIKVFFKPDEYKYYSDAIRIHSEGNENLYIPIHAYPIISNYSFPTKFNFPELPVGKSLTRNFNMRSTAPVEFEYLIEILEKNPAFHIEPLEGVIPFNRDATISVTFSPKEFSTAVMKIQLVISQFNSKPIVCSFFGSSTPGLAREHFLKKYTKLGQIGDQNATLALQNADNYSYYSQLNTGDDSNNSSDYYLKGGIETSTQSDSVKSQLNQEQQLQQQSNKSKIIASKSQIGQDVAPKKEMFVDYEGYRFPVRLDNPWAVAKVLNQSKGKISAKDLKKAASSTNSGSNKNTILISAQAKEAIFLQKVNDLEDEERRNQLKWQVKLGETRIDEQSRQEILASRAQAVYDYKLSIGIPLLEQEIRREKTINVDCRTVRDYGKIGKNDVTFDIYKNQIWELRLILLEKFIQAGRKVIIRNRLLKVLNSLKRFIESWNEALSETPENDETSSISVENYVDIYCKKQRGENLTQNRMIRFIQSRNMGTFYFPQVIEFKELQDQKARHCEKLESILKLDSLGMVAVKSIDFQMPTETPFLNLAVPIQYKLNSYKDLAENNYIPRHENRIMKLRTGAEDELSQVSSSFSSKLIAFKDSQQGFKKNVNRGEEDASKSESQTTTSIIDISPGKNLSEPVDYPPLHIFNPVPGLISYQKTLPYSGIELNYHLNPLPRFERDQQIPTQKKFLERDDVIKGAMGWKKFPSQGLLSLSNTLTLTDVWVPRWSNTFGQDVLPIETPPLLTGLPEDDKEYLLDESAMPENDDSTIEKEKKVYLTPDMVNAQFNVPGIFENREKIAREEAIKQLTKQSMYRTNLPELQFPYSDKLPSSNTPASLFGQVARDQREQELEYFLSRQYNTIGLKVQNKLVSVEKQFSASPTATTTQPQQQQPAPSNSNQP